MKHLWLLFVVVGVKGWALEILWLELTPRFAYEGLSDFGCSDDQFKVGQDPTAPLFFSAEIENTTVKRARISKSRKDVSCHIPPFPGYVEAYSLKEDECKAFELFFDEKKRAWIKNLGLNSNQLKWIFSKKQGCALTKEIVLSPSSVIFEFKPDTVFPGNYVSLVQNFHGRDEAGDVYKASLLFKQSRLRN